MFKKLLLIAALPLFISACAGNKNMVAKMYPADSLPANFQNEDYYFLESQQEVATTLRPSVFNNGIGFLSLALAAADNTATAHKTSANDLLVKTALMDFDFNSKIYDAMSRLPESQPWLGNKPMQVIAGHYQGIGFELGTLANAGTKSVAMAGGSYLLTEDYKSVYVLLTIGLYPLTEELKSAGNNKVDFTHLPILVRVGSNGTVSLGDEAGTPAENARLWSANNGARLRDALTESLANAIADLKAELSKSEKLASAK